MSKSATPRALGGHEAKAVVRMLRVSPQKLNLLAQLIRGKKVDEALADLEFSRKRIVDRSEEDAGDRRSPMPKTTMSSTSTIWSSPRLMSARRMVMKRFSPRARGRAGASRSRSRI